VGNSGVEPGAVEFTFLDRHTGLFLNVPYHKEPVKYKKKITQKEIARIIPKFTHVSVQKTPHKKRLTNRYFAIILVFPSEYNNFEGYNRWLSQGEKTWQTKLSTRWDGTRRINWRT
jgi:hypothetical protein